MINRILGVDLSLTGTGLAYVWRGGDTDTHTIGATNLTELPLMLRTTALRELLQRLVRWVGTPDLVVIEGLDSYRSYGAVHERAYLWFRLVDLFVQHEVPVIEVASARLKIYATGKGRATKKQVIAAVRETWPMFDPRNDNEADAAVLAAIGADLAGWSLAIVPDVHRRFFKDLAIPDGLVLEGVQP